MTNGYELHGITHVSASSLNTFASESALWVMERLLKRSAPVGAAAHRGSAIEDGVTHGLLNPTCDVAECQKIALTSYDRRTALSGDPKRVTEREAVEPTVSIALAELRQYGVPSEVQRRVELTLPGVPVPLLGFLDFAFGDHGLVVDLKTSLKLSSSITSAHARQVAAYVVGTNRAARVCYSTPKRLAVYELEDAPARVAELTNIAVRLERFLALSRDPEELAGLLVPNFDNYMWSNPVARGHGRETYGW